MKFVPKRDMLDWPDIYGRSLYHSRTTLRLQHSLHPMCNSQWLLDHPMLHKVEDVYRILNI